MFHGRAGRRESTVLRQVKLHAARQRSELQQRQAVLRQPQNVPGSHVHVHQRYVYLTITFGPV